MVKVYVSAENVSFILYCDFCISRCLLFKFICTVPFTIQSLQSSFTGNEVSTIYLHTVET